MRRSLVAVVLLGVALAPSAVLAQPQQAQPEIRGIDTSDFPNVAVTVSLPGQSTLSADDVELRENGEEVDVGSVEPIGESTLGVDVVLVVDTSGSMKGGPIAAAKAAAKEFVAGIPDVARVGVVTFSGTAAIALPLTGDHGKANSVLSGLSTHGSTALYDGIVKATDLFSGKAQRTIVLLSDGRDETSAASLDDAIEAAAGSEASVFAIGLESGDFDPGVLSSIAAQTNGRFLKAGTGGLGDVYRSLAVQITRQFVVRYTSSAALGAQIDIELETGGVTLSRLALAPEAERGPGGPPPTKEVTPLIRGEWGFWLVVALSFAALFLLVWMLFGAAARVQRERRAAARMSAVARPQAEEPGEGSGRRVAWIPQTMLQVAGRVVEAGGFGVKLDHDLEQAGFPMRAGEFVAVSVLAAIGGAVLGILLAPSLVVILVVAALGGVVPYLVLRVGLGRRAKRLENQLPDVLAILASSLRAGYSFLQALDTSAKEIPEPGAGEFSRAVAEIRLGRPVDEALNAMADRVGSEDFHWAVLAVNIQREVGGNLAEILDTVASTVRERQAIRREVRVLTTEGRLSMYVLVALPLLFGAYLFAVKKEYLSLLFTTRPGIIMFGTAVSLLVLGYLWIRKIVNIDV